MKTLSLCLALLILAAGCADSASPDPEQWRLQEAKAPALATCEVKNLWWNALPAHDHAPHVARLLPHHNLLIWGGGSRNTWDAYRLHEGSHFRSQNTWSLLGVSASGERRLSRRVTATNMSEFFIQDAGVRETTLALQEHPQSSASAVMSEDGRRALIAHCVPAGDKKLQELVLWDLDANSPLHRLTLASELRLHNAESLALAISPGGHHAAFVQQASDFNLGEDQPVILHTLRQDDDGSFTHATGELPLFEDEVRSSAAFPVANMTYSPAGDALHLVSYQGRHTRLSTLDLTPLSPLLPTRGAFIARPDVYSISQRHSPMAWSQDGVWASVAQDGAVELLDPARKLVHRIIAPDPAAMELHWDETTPATFNTPVSITFSPDATQVIVHFSKGVGMWGCAPTGAPVSGERSASLTAPEATIHTAGPVHVTTQGPTTAPWIAGTLSVNEDATEAIFTRDHFLWTPRQREPLQLTARLEDGMGVMESAPLSLSPAAR